MGQSSKSFRMFSVAVVVSVLAAACGGDDAVEQQEAERDPDAAQPEAPPTTETAGEQPEGATDDESVVVVSTDSDVTNIDGQVTIGLNDRWIMENVFDSILARDGTSPDPIPHLLTDFELSDDQLVWTLHLRDDIYFHNGAHMTAEDIKVSWERIMHPDLGSQNASFWAPVQEVVVVDDYTAELHMDEPNPLLMVFGQILPIVPKSRVDDFGYQPDPSDQPVGSGPYKIVEWRRDDQLVLEAFDDYFLGRPEIDRVIFRPVPNEAARVAGLRAGELDLIFPLSPHLAEEIESDPDLDVRSAASMERVRLSIDTREAPWDVREVRQAINYALDVDSIAETLVPGAVPIPAALVPEEVGFNPDLEPYPYDPDRARELLAQAGFTDGIGPVELSVNRGYPNASEVGQAIASQLADVGIRTEIREYDAGDFNTRKGEKDENPAALGPLMFDGHAGGNTFHGFHHYTSAVACDGSPVHSGYYCNPEIDALIDEALSIWGSDEQRGIELFQQAEEMLHEDAWAGFLFQTPRLYGVRASLDWQPDATGQLQMRQARWE